MESEAKVLVGKRILMIIGGGIAAYKALELIRLLRGQGVEVVPVLTRAGAEFVTPLSVSALANTAVHQDLFDLTHEAEIGHIQLSRAADLVVVVPATADLMAKMAQGMANDLASTLLLATDKRVLMAPAMNVRMWDHPATQRNLRTLEADGVLRIGPDDGAMACGEFGPGRMAEPLAILAAISDALQPADKPLDGNHILVTSGPTHEPIDPVRYIANRSSGAQGTAIAQALLDLGAKVTFITGPAEVPPPAGADVVRVETASQMRAAVQAALPADAGVFAAAVADWHVVGAGPSKIKKVAGQLPQLNFAENPDILAEVGHMTAGRPRLVVGFAAETDDVIAHARAKRLRKGADWIVANDVSPATGIMGGAENEITIITAEGETALPRMSKPAVAKELARRIADTLLKDDA
ncbi:phosphopantothenoylcysteine synthase/decarboxylase [Ketogulonicigenium vulgare]|nr:bifunctional phosphopantothenoylcysteine decarboxylase/phosphopantothenate synthase [Ketogulonicigenium vulgare]AOZ53513.1 phosphopantothenoylcysteine synthase/decarboxylase [Ketogulonicigenium vulgare]